MIEIAQYDILTLIPDTDPFYGVNFYYIKIDQKKTWLAINYKTIKII